MADSKRHAAFALSAPLPPHLHGPLAARPRARANALRKRRYTVAQWAPRMSAPAAPEVPTPSDENPPNSISSADRDALLMDPDDREFAEWAGTAESEDPAIVSEDEEALPLETLLGLEGDGRAEMQGLEGEEEVLGMAAGFSDDDDDVGDDEEGSEDEDEDEDEDDEDEELAARAGSDDFDDDIGLVSISKDGDRDPVQSRRLNVVENDDNDEVEDVEEGMEPIEGDLSPMFDGEENVDGDVNVLADTAVATETGDGDPTALFDESEEDIQSAADILSSSGLLGLGVVGSKRADVSEVTSFALGQTDGAEADSSSSSATAEITGEEVHLDAEEEQKQEREEEEEEEEEEEVEEDESSFDDAEPVSEKGIGLDGYKDDDDDDDIEFTLLTESSGGRIWEMNDDNYVTITEAGQSYAYELDEEDEEDQEMATMRRGKQGGWSGGLASYSAAQLPKGSREWVARRAYEMMTEASPKDMFMWTRRRKGPPATIKELYPDGPPVPPKLPRTRLEYSTPDSTTPTIGTDSSASNEESEVVDPGVLNRLPVPDHNALERSVKFPCLFKFKVEGGLPNDGNKFAESLAQDLERVLKRPVSHADFEVEPAGRYKRVVMMVNVESAAQVTEVYDALRSNPSVKYSFG